MMMFFLSLIPLLAGCIVQILLLEYEVGKFLTPDAAWIPTPTLATMTLSILGLASSIVALATAFWVIVRHLDVPRLFWYSLGASITSVLVLWALLGDTLPAILIP
ncbi:hypothetical protein HY374_04255 [Candidatus Berkelbacteria bacterium]|nr:hypothetical protein [Candidatus Berkelbacteria bacterium]